MLGFNKKLQTFLRFDKISFSVCRCIIQNRSITHTKIKIHETEAAKICAEQKSASKDFIKTFHTYFFTKIFSRHSAKHFFKTFSKTFKKQILKVALQNFVKISFKTFSNNFFTTFFRDIQQNIFSKQSGSSFSQHLAKHPKSKF